MPHRFGKLGPFGIERPSAVTIKSGSANSTFGFLLKISIAFKTPRLVVIFLSPGKS